MTVTRNQVPEGWSQTTVGNTAKVVAGFAFPLKYQGKKKGDFPFIKVSDMNLPGNEKYIYRSENYLDKEDLMRVKVRSYPAGTVIFPKVGAALLTNKRRVLVRDTIVDNNIMGLIPQSIDPDFLYYWALNFDVTNHIGNGALPSINQGYVEKLEILLPSASEQSSIASILNVVDLEIQKVTQIIAESEKLKRGLMQKMFTNSGWKSVQISDVASVVTGGTPRTSVPEYWDGTIPWMSSGEVNLRRVNKTEKFITEAGLKNSNAQLLPSGTVMLALAGQGRTRGKVAILDIETTCNQSLAGMIASPDKLIDEFLFYNLEFRYQELRNISGGEGRAGLNLKLIKEFEIPLPPLRDQKQIASTLSSIDEKISINQRIKGQLAFLKKGLMNDLLKGKKRTV